MNLKELKKSENEVKIFTSFAKLYQLPVDLNSIVSKIPPFPDIEYSINGIKKYAELVEIVDTNFARACTLSSEPVGFIDPENQLLKKIYDKDNKPYSTNGDHLFLIAFFDKMLSHIMFELDFDDLLGDISKKMIDSGKWQGIWIYDSWNQKILWSFS